MQRLIFTIVLMFCVLMTLGCAQSEYLETYYAETHYAAQRGDAEEQYYLGYMYYTGQGQWVAKDYAAARHWFEKAAAQGHANSQHRLGIMYFAGQGVIQDYATARIWFEKAAAQGVTDSQKWLGDMYYVGIGVTRDYATARIWFEKAAAQTVHVFGVAHAQNNQDKVRIVVREYDNMGHLVYENLAGLPSTPAKAQNKLGVMYYLGQGVAKDYAAARNWFEKAAAQGLVDAKKKLTIMDQKGL